MRRLLCLGLCLFVFPAALAGQSKRLWVVRAPGEAVEYDATTFAEKQTVKVPAEAVGSPQDFSINHAGQMLFAASVALPLAEGDASTERKNVWFWDGHATNTIPREVSRTTTSAGSNLAIGEAAAMPALSADGTHVFWFSNKARRLQRDGVDLSTKTTWLCWRTDLAAANREELASIALPECSCPTGGCEESCPYGETWVPEGGVDEFFLLSQFVAGQTKRIYKSTSVYQRSAGKWAGQPTDRPLQRVLDATNPGSILEAIPDTGCCGWSNESDDQTVLHLAGKTSTVFDELGAYKNPDYDVSFYTEKGKLSPDLTSVALTIKATSAANQPIQMAEQGQANPEESQRIRKAIMELPAVEVKHVGDPPGRIAFLPHASLVGWISEKEILIVEDHLLVTYNLTTGARRKSSIPVEDAAHAFLR